MPTIVEAALDAEAFSLGRALDVDRDVTVELAPVLPTGDRRSPYFWGSGADLEAFETAVERDPRIRAVRRHVNVQAFALFSVEWTEPVRTPFDVVDEAAGSILSGVREGGRWSFSLRFPDEDRVAEFRERAERQAFDVDIERAYTVAADDVAGDGLTGKQRTALATALREGYFRVPREVTQEELATELGVQSSAVSETLRRATAELVANTLGTEPARDP